jgi:ABC-2 type transport system ATP-binding protein
MSLIFASNLHKSYGDTIAVNGVNLEVAAGEIYGLVGPDGAGKTTTIRLLCGALTPDRPAQIHIAGIDLQHQPEPARAQIGYLAQRFSLYEDLTVLENLRFFAEVRGLNRAEWQPRCLEILEFVGLAEFVGRRAGQLSGGMKQKLGLAAALVHRPRVLLLDEPTTGVDPVTRQDFWQLILKLASTASLDEAIAVFVSTPYMDEAARCQRVGFMRDGAILLEGTPEVLRARLNDRILELRGTPLALLRRLAEATPGVEDAQMFGDRLHLRIQGGAAPEVMVSLRDGAAAQGGAINLLRLIPPQLEDVFISLLENPS